jgi:peptidoglycan-associated lipoprotein
MRRVILVALATAGLATLAGCPSKPKNGECKSSADCADQQGFGKVCVEGRCQECAADSDCKDGFVCRTNKCVPKPQCGKDSDCPQGQVCQNEKCVVSQADLDAEAARRRAAEEAERAKNAVPPECSDAAAFSVQFGFDKSELVPESQAKLQKLADCLKRAPAKKVTVEGNCDERGTTQYNIALGARRADAARKYLSDLGAQTKLETVSFGKEKPICTEQTEDCWAKNRRDDFKVER